MKKRLMTAAVITALIAVTPAWGGEKEPDLERVQKRITETVRKAAASAVKTPSQKPAPAAVQEKKETAEVPVTAVRTIPKPPETIRPLSQVELLKTIDTMAKNFELNQKEMDKKLIIDSIKNLVEREKRKEEALKRFNEAFQRAMKDAEDEPEEAEKKADPDRLLSAEEKAKEAAKNRAKIAVTELSLNTHEEDIETLIDNIRRAAGVNMVMDSRAIAQGIANGTVRATVTLKVENMALKNALNWITRLSGLVWTLKDEAIFITTPDRAINSDHKLRIYDIRDQMAPIPDFPAPDSISFGISDDPMNF